MEWSEEKCLQLISAYKQHKLLWQAKHPQHYNKLLKQVAWDEIAQEVNTDTEECKKKMCSLLASFRRENAKIKKDRGNDDMYQSSWFAFKAMIFLQVKDEPRRSSLKPQENIEWNHSNIERVIHLYSLQPALWDSSNNNFHIKNHKNDAWELIASHMGCDSEEVKNKMASLLSSYRREKIKIKKFMGNAGKGREVIYQPKWFAFKYFNFLRDKDTSTNSINTENSFVGEEASLQLSEDVLDEQNELSNTAGSSSDDRANTPAKEDREPSKRKRIFSSKNTDKKSKKKIDQRLAETYNILESVGNVPNDECTTFGEHIVAKLRKFDEQQRSVLMHRINNLIFEAETELYSQDHI